MAKSSLLRGRSKKKVKVTKNMNKIIQENYFGKDEPVIPQGVFTGMKYAGALHWYGVMGEFYDPKRWIITYLKNAGRDSDAERMSRVPDKWIPPTLWGQTRLLERGAKLAKESMAAMEIFIQRALKHENAPVDVDPDDEENPTQMKPTIADRKSDRTSDILGELEGLIDDGFYENFTLDGWYRQNNVKDYTIKRIIEKFTPMRDQLTEAIQRFSKKECMEEFGIDKEEAEVFHDMYEWIIEDSERFILNAKQQKTPRAKKPMSMEKKLKFITESYQKHSKDYNISSIDPSKILSAQELWTFNTKYKIATVFRAGSHGGQLDVARCKIAGFDPNQSMSYRVGRKPEQVLETVLKGTRAQLKKLTLKTCNLQERINENTVLLKVY